MRHRETGAETNIEWNKHWKDVENERESEKKIIKAKGSEGKTHTHTREKQLLTRSTSWRPRQGLRSASSRRFRTEIRIYRQ